MLLSAISFALCAGVRWRSVPLAGPVQLTGRPGAYGRQCARCKLSTLLLCYVKLDVLECICHMPV